VPASAVGTMWALLAGRLTTPTRGSGTGAAPFLLYSVALWLPVYGVVSYASLQVGRRASAEVGMAAALVFLLWQLPLPIMWRRLLRRWELS